MACAPKKIDSNVTGLRYAEEECIGELPTTPVWRGLDPNSYNDFGGNFTKVARATINTKRSRFKGTLTDLDASGGFNIDVTQNNVQGLMQGFMYDRFAEKGLRNPSAVTATAYTVTTGTTAFRVGSLVWASGFTNPANNGLKVATAVTVTAVTCAGLVAEAAPPADAKIVNVGQEFASGDATLTQGVGALPVLGSAAVNLTQLGLVPGEFIFIGGDAVVTQFGTLDNNGWARVRSVAAAAVTLDKTERTIVTDAGAAKTIRVFYGRVLKNKEGSGITRTSYQLERSLGNQTGAGPDQAEYLVGSVPNELTLVVDTANKVNMDLAFMSTDYQTVEPGFMKAGTRPAFASGSAFNTSTHFSRIKMGLVSPTVSNVTALFAYVTEMRLTIKNNNSANKAIGTLGAFDMSAGTFEVGGSVTAYFQNVTALQALRNNSDVTFDVVAVKDNAGFAFDLPLLTLGDGRLNVELNTAVTIPLALEAADAGEVASTLGHTLMVSFFDYLPDLAEG